MKDYRNLIWNFSSNSSGGQYLKSEKNDSNGIKYYYKLSDFGYMGFQSHEAVLEVIASRLGIALGLPVLKYTGDMAKITIDNKDYTTFVTRSRNYCKSGKTAIPLITDYELNKMPNELPLDYCKRIGLTEFVDYLFIFDYLIMNTDRHGRNIELLYSYEKTEAAPIFDNGRCLTFNCGNQLTYITKWNYKDGGMGNNFLGGIYLENNLNHVSKPYKLPDLTEKRFRHIFYGLSGILEKQHIQIIKEGLKYRYNILVDKGVVICENTL